MLLLLYNRARDGLIMLDYENMYKILFYGITSAIRDIEKQNFGMAMIF